MKCGEKMVNVGTDLIKSITTNSINKNLGNIDGSGVTGSSETLDFGAFLNDAITKVNNLQNDADELKINFAAGKTDNIQDVMIAMQKADVAFQMTVQVRNKILEAYQEIMRMPM